ncbi:hypothetical protein HDU78_009174 [Chytriomyces hyalinus]|nr:hypothetical protein HDU78_009174 [Chytriomyces hyalinus]
MEQHRKIMKRAAEVQDEDECQRIKLESLVFANNHAHLPKDQSRVELNYQPLTQTLRDIMEEFKSYIPKPKFCLGQDKIIDHHCWSLFRQGFPAVDKEIVDYVQAHFGINAISEVDSEYHHSKKTYPHIRHMSELRFMQVILMPLIAKPFCQDKMMYWNGPEAPVHGTARRCNLYKDLNVDKVKLPRKADGIVRLQNYDSNGLEAMLLEVSGPPSAKDLSKHAEDFFTLSQEHKDHP